MKTVIRKTAKASLPLHAQTISNVYSDPLLKNIFLGYSNPNFYADTLLPPLKVEKRTGYYYEWDQANLRSEDDLQTGRAEAKIVDDEAVKRTYGPLLKHALKTFIEDDLIQHSEITNLRTARAERLRHRMFINKEVAVANILTNSSDITQTETLAGGDQWDDYNNSNPYGDLEDLLEQVRTGSMQKANKLAFGIAVWKKLKYHPDTIELLKATGGGKFTIERLKDWLEVDEIVILDSQAVTSKEGQTVTRGDIWGKVVLAMYVNPNPEPTTEEVSAGYTLTLNPSANDVTVKYWEEEDPEGEWVKATDYYEHKIVAAGAIARLKSVVS